MKKILALTVVAAFAMIIIGCGGKKTTTPSSNALNVAPPPSPVAPIPTTPTAAGPTNYNSTPTPTPFVEEAVKPAAGKPYTVKHGDTLWGIAQRTYGSGKEYKKIVAANPSIKGESVKVGQVITLP